MGRAVSRLAPATCGELVQGTLDGRDFLVTSPIDLFSAATAERSIEAGARLVDEEGFAKVARALEIWNAGRRLPIPGVEVRVETRLLRGKGLASSSSEITAALAAAAAAAETELSTEELSAIATQVDPTDAVYAKGIVACNPLTGEIFERLGPPPRLKALVVDTGGGIDSAEFDRERARANSRSHERELREALRRVRIGMRLGEARLVAAGATLSAEIHQLVLEKPLFREASRLRRLGALGVCVAHTGSVIGVLYEPDPRIEERLIRAAERRFGSSALLGAHRLIGGGVRSLRRAHNSLDAFASTGRVLPGYVRTMGA